MDYLSGKVRILSIYPITKELSLTLLPDGFSLQWSFYKETYLVVLDSSGTLYSSLTQSLEVFSTYQREPFSQGSSTHQWIWHYDRNSSPWLKVAHPKFTSYFRSRATVAFHPSHVHNGSQIYLKQQLRKRENEFIEENDLQLAIFTWNAGASHPDHSLRPWFTCANKSTGPRCTLPDLVIVGLQEACELNALNLLNENQSKNPWLQFLVAEVNSHYDLPCYELLCSETLVGLVLVVLVKEEHLIKISKVRHTFTRLGMGGYAGNKGAVGIRFNFFHTSFCFINCHLAAHKGHASTRNKQAGKVMNEIGFELNGVVHSTSEHDFFFLFGDLNYRIRDLTHKEIIEKLNTGMLEQVFQEDELSFERYSQNTFAGFQEGIVKFRPTFKVERGKDEYK
jgi:hypothetical protein